jgi:hypothetical protein
MDPDGKVIAARDFDSSRVVLSVKPDQFGKYTATITNMQDSADRIETRVGYGYEIMYGFGHLTSAFEGVSNPAGDTIAGMVICGQLIILPGSVMLSHGIVRAYKRKRKSLPDVSR